jgi:hypothetical protein
LENHNRFVGTRVSLAAPIQVVIVEPGKEILHMRRSIIALAAFACTIASSMAADAQDALAIKPLAEKKVAELPAGTLHWRIETFASRNAAEAAAGPWSLVVEADGRVWLFTLGPAGGATLGGTKVADVGPIPRVSAPQYLLRINEAKGARGSVTPIHTHPGSEAFFVLTGEQSIRGPDGVLRVAAGQASAGRGADVPMQVSSSGPEDLRALVMFVVDATRPFSSPSTMP